MDYVLNAAMLVVVVPDPTPFMAGLVAGLLGGDTRVVCGSDLLMIS